MLRFARVVGFSLLLVVVSREASSEPPRLQHGSAYPSGNFERQFQALTRISRPIDVEYTARGAVRMLKGTSGDTAVRLEGWDSLKVGDRAPKVVQTLSDLLMANGTEELTVASIHPFMGERTINFRQSIRGIPVIEGGGLSVGVVGATGNIKLLYSYFVPDYNLPHRPSLSAESAAALAVEYLAKDPTVEQNSAEATHSPSLAYYGGAADGAQPALVWVVKVAFVSVPNARQADWKEVLVNAATGSIVAQRPLTFSALIQSVYSSDT